MHRPGRSCSSARRAASPAASIVSCAALRAVVCEGMLRSMLPVPAIRPVATVAVAALLGGAWVAASAAQQADEPDPESRRPACSTARRSPASTTRLPTPCARPASTTSSPSPRPSARSRPKAARRCRCAIQEIDALARLDGLDKAGVFARAAGESLVKVGAGVVDAVTDPVATAKGIGGGVKRLGVNLGRRTKRQVQKITTDDPSKPDEGAGAKWATPPRRRPRGCSASTARAGAGPGASAPIRIPATRSCATRWRTWQRWTWPATSRRSSPCRCRRSSARPPMSATSSGAAIPRSCAS